ncbi:MAG: tetratricopeptide repeat protein [Magnetospirillum sp.]|nr:tetratricopeptide repeat protein [Magnetospirillum sp.]
MGYDKVLDLARKGHPYPAVELLRQLHASRPDEPGLAADLVSVLGWAGEASELLRVVATLPPKRRTEEPILQAAARAHRSLRQYGKALELYRDGRKRFPTNPVYAVGEVRTLVDAGRPAEAVAMARGAAQAFPNDVELLMALAAAQEAERQPEDASATYGRVLEVAPAHDEARRRRQALVPQGTAYRRAIALARSGKAEQALPTLRATRTQAPEDAAVAYDLIVVLSWAGRHAEAITEFERLDPAAVPAWVLREAAAAYRARKRPDKAVGLYRRALAQTPDDLGLTMGLARALSESGQGKDALAVVRDEGVQRSRDPSALMLTAELCERHRDFDGARAAYERVLALAPKRVDARRGLRRVLPSTTAYTHAIDEARAGRTTEAEALLSALRTADPGDTTVTADLVAVLSWGGRHAEAVAAFSALPTASRAPAYVVGAAAHSYRELRNYAEAATLYQRALQRSPQPGPLMAALTATLLDAERNDEAAPWLDQLLKREPRNPEVHILDGRRHEAARAFDKAAAAYRRAAELSADEARRRHAEAAVLRMEYASLIRNAHDGNRGAALERLAQAACGAARRPRRHRRLRRAAGGRWARRRGADVGRGHRPRANAGRSARRAGQSQPQSRPHHRSCRALPDGLGAQRHGASLRHRSGQFPAGCPRGGKGRGDRGGNRGAVSR